jgi:DNA polymerase-3 subunit delta
MKPVYLFTGQEQFLAKEEVRKQIDQLLPDGRDAFNFQVFVAGESSVQDVMATVLTPAFGSGPKVVLVRDFHVWKAQDTRQLLPLLEKWPPRSTLILWGEKVDKQTKFYQQFSKAGLAQDFPKLSARELPRWLEGRAKKQYGLKLTRAIAATFIRLIGDDLRLLDQELAKLATYLGPENNQPSAADLEAVCWQAAAVNIFALVDAIGKRNSKTALNLLERTLADGEKPIWVLVMIARQMRIIFQLKAIAGNSQLERQLGLPPFVVRQCKEQARGFKWSERDWIFRALFRADLALKSSQEASLVLEGLVLELCSGRERKV